jgi:hypothetical protein
MQLDRDDLCTVLEQLCGDRASPSADVDDQVAGMDACLFDETGRPLVSESIPAPRPAVVPGHGEPRS